MEKSDKQLLVDICFELVLTATDPRYQSVFSKLDNEGKANWVADQLRKCGFDTEPLGSSWGVLKDDMPNYISAYIEAARKLLEEK